jgi:hypothetical protein
VTQQQEIVAMRLALGQPLPPPASAPDQAMADDTARGWTMWIRCCLMDSPRIAQ